MYTPINRNKPLTPEIDVLGDCHLGKRFHTGVPLDRRGEREEMVWQDFETSLVNTAARFHVQVGDLFDSFLVPLEVVLRAADAYITAALANPDTLYVTYSGNHDRSRTEGKVSSFDLFKRLVAHVPNIRVLLDVDVFGVRDGGNAPEIAFIPWHPFRPAAELASLLTGTYSHVFGHWDCTSFGGNDHNLIPLDELAGKTTSIVTGHEHNAREFDHGDMHVTVVGSMQPYSHAEDPAGEFYVTMTLDEYAERGAEDLSSRNVRFVLKEGEALPEIDALSVSCKTVTDTAEEVGIDVEFETFDIRELLDDSLTEAGVGETVAITIGEKFNELRAAE